MPLYKYKTLYIEVDLNTSKFPFNKPGEHEFVREKTDSIPGKAAYLQSKYTERMKYADVACMFPLVTGTGYYGWTGYMEE